MHAASRVPRRVALTHTRQRPRSGRSSYSVTWQPRPARKPNGRRGSRATALPQGRKSLWVELVAISRTVGDYQRHRREKKVQSYRQRNLKPAHPSSLVIALLLKKSLRPTHQPADHPRFSASPPPAPSSVRPRVFPRADGRMDGLGASVRGKLPRSARRQTGGESSFISSSPPACPPPRPDPASWRAPGASRRRRCACRAGSPPRSRAPRCRAPRRRSRPRSSRG